MENERLRKQIDFILEADKEKNILRRTHLSGNGRRENDAEHAWHMAIMIYLLKEYANEEFDMAKAMLMALIHDIVEIDAGDTYAFDSKGMETKEVREAQAAKRLFGMLPEDQGEELKSLFEEYEANETSEARFVRVMDNFQPLLLNNSNNGRDWIEHGIGKSQVMQRHISTKLGSKVIWECSEEIIEDHVRRGNLKDE